MTPPAEAPPESPGPSPFRTLGRAGLLVALVAVSGVVLGFAVAWPVSRIELDVRTAKQLNQDSLVGTFAPESALASLEDLPDGWSAGDPNVVRLVDLVGAPICGTTPEVENQLGDTLSSVHQDPAGRQFVVSQVLRTRSTRDANQYIQDIADAFDCPSFFYVGGGERTRIEVRDGQPDPPLTDYVSRTLVATEGGLTRRVAFFQVGDVVVVLQTVGPTRPPDDLLADAQLSILRRIDPEDFPLTEEVDGARPLPEEPTTSLGAAPAEGAPAPAPPESAD